MPTTYTPNASEMIPGQIAGAPVRLPALMCCTSGEVFCGRVWTANTREQFVEKAAEKRKHEMGCQGGLIVVGG